MTDDDLLGLRVHLTCGVPDRDVGLHQLRQEVDVADGQPQRVHLGESLLVGQRGDVRAQALERVVDGLHPPPLTHVRRLPQLLHLSLRAHAPPAFQRGFKVVVVVVSGRWRPVRRTRGRGGEGQVPQLVVSVRVHAILPVIVLEVSGQEVHVVVQEVVRVHVSVSGRLVSAKVFIVEVGRVREGDKGVQHTVHHLCVSLCLLAVCPLSARHRLYFGTDTRGWFIATTTVACH